MLFSPAYLASLLILPTRYFFEHYASEDLRWSEDPKQSMIDIGSINDFHKLAIQTKPRILVSRGQYAVNPVGLSDNMAEGKSVFETRGTKNVTNMVIIQGVAQIMVEARNEGTCEKVVDHLQHFLAWTGPMIANTHGFKNSFLPLNVSPCTPSREDTEIFSCTINIPWLREEHWNVTGGDDIKIKAFLLSISAK